MKKEDTKLGGEERGEWIWEEMGEGEGDYYQNSLCKIRKELVEKKGKKHLGV